TGVEVQIANTGGNYYLPDNTIVRNKRIVGMFIPDNTGDTAYSPSGRPLASNAAILSSYITLKAYNDDILSEHPCSELLITTADKSILLVELCNVNPQKSTILIGNAAALVTAGESIMIQFI